MPLPPPSRPVLVEAPRAPAVVVALPPAVVAAKPAAMADRQDDAARVLREALNAHDARKLASAYSENAVITSPGMPDAAGRAAIAAGAQNLFDAFSNFKYGVTRAWTKGDVVVSEWVGTGTHSGDFAGLKATEKPVGWTAVSVRRFSPDGLIREEHVYWDTTHVRSQIAATVGKPYPMAVLPAGAPEIHVAASTPGEDANVDVGRRISAASNARNEGEMFGLYADTLERWHVGVPGPSKGKEDTKKGWRAFVAAFPDTSSTVVDAWGVEDWVIEEAVLIGTQKGNFAGIAATRKPITLHTLEIFQVKGGKVTRDWSCPSTPELLIELGVLGPSKK